MLPKRNYNDLLDIPFNMEHEYMKTDIFSHDDRYVIEIDLPGILGILHPGVFSNNVLYKERISLYLLFIVCSESLSSYVT